MVGKIEYFIIAGWSNEEGRISDIPNHCPLDMHGGGVSGCVGIGSLHISSCCCRGVWWWGLFEHFMYTIINTRLFERTRCFKDSCTYTLTTIIWIVSRQARSGSGKRSRDTSDLTSTFHNININHILMQLSITKCRVPVYTHRAHAHTQTNTGQNDPYKDYS